MAFFRIHSKQGYFLNFIKCTLSVVLGLALLSGCAASSVSPSNGTSGSTDPKVTTYPPVATDAKGKEKTEASKSEGLSVGETLKTAGAIVVLVGMVVFAFMVDDYLDGDCNDTGNGCT